MRSRRRGRGRRGFTLAELLVTLCIIAIAAALAVPPFQAAMAYFRTRTAIARLTADLAYTRQLAARNGQRARLVVERSPDCPEAAGASGHRYRVAVTVNGAEQVAARVDLRLGGGRICLFSNQSSEVVFNSRGLLVGFNNRTLTVREGSHPPRTITVSAVGRVLPR